MEHLQTIYRNFDIRGKFGDELTTEEVEKIGYAIVGLFKAMKIAVGRDIRPSADELFAALARGINAAGAKVLDLGIVTTPMTYFVGGKHDDIEVTVMITASHMTSEYNGLKITIEDAKPVSADTLQVLRKIVGEHTYSAESVVSNIEEHPVHEAWAAHFENKFSFAGTPMTIVVDPANMVGVLEIATLKQIKGLEVHAIYDEYDHTAPNHEANPVKLETMRDLGHAVVEQGAVLGVAFDGDADRVGFVDETGQPIPSDIIGTLLARHLMKQHPGAHVVYDVRSTKRLPETVAALGGTSVKEKVGHTHIRKTMREHESILGVELSGHFFFKESHYSEGGPLPLLYILELLQQEQKPLSALAKEVATYAQSGEINSHITRPADAIFADIKAQYPEAAVETIDGLTLMMPTWWCNIRLSANDPVMRLNVEADTQNLCAEVTETLLEIIRRE